MNKLTSSHKVFLHEYNSPAWNLCSYCLLRKQVSFDTLETAMNEVARKNDALRMAVKNGDEVFFTEYAPRRFERFEFSDEASFLAWAHERANEPVTNYPGMWTAFLIKINGQIGIYNIGQHIICDALNVANLYQKIADELGGHPGEGESYAAYLDTHERYLQSRQHDKDRQYWEPILSERAQLAFAGRSFGKCENITMTLPPVDAFCTELGLSKASVMYAAAGLLLMRLQNLDTLSIGIPVLGRTTQREMGSLGLFMHDVPMIMRGGEKSFLDFAREVENNLIDLFRHQRYDLPQSALFDVSVDYSEYPKTEDYDAGVIYSDFVSTAMEFHFLQREQLELTIRAQTGLFKNLDAVADAMVRLIRSAAANPQQSIWTLSIADLPVMGNKVEIADVGIYSLIESQDAGRIVDAEREYSLAELRQDAEKIDAAIHGEKRIIGVLCERSYAELAAIYGIIRGGNAYLPISPSYPPERIQLLLEQSGCKTVLAQRKYQNLAKGSLAIEDIISGVLPAAIPPVAAGPDDPLYVIFTSGSTGTPKGAMVSNRSAVNRIQWMCRKYFSPETVVVLKTPYTFDVSVWEIFGFALGGFTLYILPPEDHYRQDRVIEHIRRGKVTDIHFVPTVFSRFLDVLEKDGGDLLSLRNIFLSGEALNASLRNRTSVPVHNLYGPTECAVDVTYYDCAEQESDPVPIGKPIDNCQIYVLDQRLQPLPQGVVGQICIGGVSVGLGYVNDAKKTAGIFVTNPFAAGQLYQTGDLGYWREDGQLVFVGRADNQVKIHGQRIELGEIEAAMCEIVPVAAVTVVGSRLLAFYTGEKRNDLREKLSRVLPRHMVPSRFIHIEEMPMTTSGKIDRKALTACNHVDHEFVPPVGETETSICTLFSRVLDVRDVGRTDNFYDLGGTSLSMMELLCEDPLASLSPLQFMVDPTPAGLAASLLHLECCSSFVPLYTPDHADFAYVLFPYAGGDAAAYTALVAEFRKRKAPISLFFVPWGCDYEKASGCLQSISLPLGFYSHCAGAVIAMKLLDRLDCVKKVFIGANIPPLDLSNIWNSVSDQDLLSALRLAGMPELRRKEEMLERFRDHTDEYFEYFRRKMMPSLPSVELVLGRRDPFTEPMHCSAKELWNRYVSDVNRVHFIDTSSHYFQTTHSAMLTDILLEETQLWLNM